MRMIIPLWNDSNNKDGIKWLVTGTFPGGPYGKESACNVETQVQSLGQEDPWRKDGNPLQYSCLENSMDRGTWWATVLGVLKRQTQLRD